MWTFLNIICNWTCWHFKSHFWKGVCVPFYLLQAIFKLAVFFFFIQNIFFFDKISQILYTTLYAHFINHWNNFNCLHNTFDTGSPKRSSQKHMKTFNIKKKRRGRHIKAKQIKFKSNKKIILSDTKKNCKPFCIKSSIEQIKCQNCAKIHLNVILFIINTFNSVKQKYLQFAKILTHIYLLTWLWYLLFARFS